MRLGKHAVTAGLLLSGAAAIPAGTFAQQETDRPETIRSMGFPQTWRPSAGFAVSWDRRADPSRATGEISFGVFNAIGNPVMGLLGVSAEGYGEFVEGSFRPGARVFASFPLLHLHLGADYSSFADDVAFTTALTVPLRRGGIIGRGSQVRLQWTPARSDYLSLGLQIPVFQPYAGTTRARHDRIGLPRRTPRRADPAPLSRSMHELLGTMSHAAAWIRRYTIPVFDDRPRDPTELAAELGPWLGEFKRHFELRSDLFPAGHSYDAEVRVFHDSMDRVFELIAGDRETGERIAAHARREILEQIILPYDRLLGRRKMRDSLLALGDEAIRGMDDWLKAETGLPSELRRRQAVTAFERIVAMLDQERAQTLARWHDNRYVWVPLQFALRPEQHDETHEIDALIERLTESEFTEGNRMIFVANEQFQAELARMILATRDYHVLWIHDFRGVNSAGEPDLFGYRMSRVYLQALTRAVEAYDERGSLPALMVFLDQHYYELNRADLWLRLLADPLRHEVELPDGFEHMRRGIEQDRRALQTAIAAAGRLQLDRARWGDDWLRNTVKVHVSITNPPDFSFRSRHVIPRLRFIPDNLMRDHRKVAFRDVTEEDPGLGEALFTGEGIGEHYVGPTWDDRAVLVEGPSLVGLKTAARELLRSQGFRPEEVPAPLRAKPYPPDYEQLVAERTRQDIDTRGMQLHNATGFGDKQINPAKAGLYTLMPAGSHIWVPDSLWSSPLWASMLVGAAFRGTHVVPGAPSLANAPSPAAPAMSRVNEIFATFVAFNEHLGDVIGASGGRLLPGIYDIDFDASDMAARIAFAAERIADGTPQGRLLPFPESTREMLAAVPEIIERAGIERVPLTPGFPDGRPRLHLKAQLFMSREVIDTFLPLESLGPLLQRYYVERAMLAGIGDGYTPIRDVYARLSMPGMQVLDEWEDHLTDEQRDRLVAYFIGGSHNQNYRSTMMDGEIMYLASGLGALATFPEMLMTIASMTWITRTEQLEELLPPFEGFARRLGRWIENAL